MLFIISTPIGNLGDISERALEALRSCDAILCEDTRRSSILLDRYGIKKPLVSYHKFKEMSALEEVLRDLEEGRKMALISDAGTPCINDPGQILAEACAKRGIPFTALPGPCSLIQALVLSGFESERFQFVGFFPKKGKGWLRQLLCYPGTSIGFESPQRLVATLEEIGEMDPERRIAVAREMTKTYEECRRGTPAELLSHFRKGEPKGEIVLVIAQGEIPEEPFEVEELVQMLQDLHGLSLKEAIRLAAKLKGVSKRDVYRKFCNDESI
jgi:16S rRNA (cytidine1402-2'-O)-methyltransferase